MHLGLSGTFLENIDGKFEERNKEKVDKALMRNESRNVKENIPEIRKELLEKENLVKVAAHYGITPAVGATKSHILDLIKDHCVENDIIDEVEEKPIAETAEVVRLKLDFEREERRLAREEAQRARDAEKAFQDAQLAQARELRLAELKEARELRELELKAEREKRDLELKAEQEKALLEAEKEAAVREHELKMAGLGKHPPSDKASAFDPARNIRLVPPFKKRRLINILLILRKLLIV